MPCHSAIEHKNISVYPEDTVEFALAALEKEGVRALAVIDEDGEFQGTFSMKVLLGNLIPVSVAMSNGIQMDVKVPAAPGVAKRLRNVKTLPVRDLMNRKPTTISPDAPIWEGVGVLTKNGSPLCVVDHKNKFHGFITYESLINDLENMETTDS